MATAQVRSHAFGMATTQPQSDTPTSDFVAQIRANLEGYRPAHIPREILTAHDVADLLRVSKRTVSRFVERGELEAIYLTEDRRTLRFARRALVAFIESKMVC